MYAKFLACDEYTVNAIGSGPTLSQIHSQLGEQAVEIRYLQWSGFVMSL